MGFGINFRRPDNCVPSETAGAFQGSGLEEISLPKTLNDICENAFQDCTRLAVAFVAESCPADVRRRIP